MEAKTAKKLAEMDARMLSGAKSAMMKLAGAQDAVLATPATHGRTIAKDVGRSKNACTFLCSHLL